MNTFYKLKGCVKDYQGLPLEVQGANIVKKKNHAVSYLFGSVTSIQTGKFMSI